MQPDPLTTMLTCQGESCDCVPDDVFDAVTDAFNEIPGGRDPSNDRDARAKMIASRMAKEGWRFCPCFPAQRTEQHARTFDLVHTRLANRLADKAAMERAA
ncbi:MAG TPA: hypothetical protein VF865_09175 [Acidobacteriaceae bacterium]